MKKQIYSALAIISILVIGSAELAGADVGDSPEAERVMPMVKPSSAPQQPGTAGSEPSISAPVSGMNEPSSPALSGSEVEGAKPAPRKKQQSGTVGGGEMMPQESPPAPVERPAQQ